LWYKGVATQNKNHTFTHSIPAKPYRNDVDPVITPNAGRCGFARVNLAVFTNLKLLLQKYLPIANKGDKH